MCGITGAVWFDPRVAVAADTLQRMTDALRHRGPDDEGAYIDHVALHDGSGRRAGVALGHRRLSIIDLAGGHQPLANEDGSVWVVFNGEIYNYPDLHRRLEGSGHRFRTRCDTEVLVHLYEDEGAGMLRHLNGMFALAIWDAPRQQLLLARDRLGQKPLVYRLESDRLLFSSELKSLMQVPEIPRELDPAAIDAYLTYQYVPHPRTIYRGFCKLPPAHYAVYHDRRLQVERYWEPGFDRPCDRPRGEYVDELRRMLTSAVQLRLQSDVPLGAFLSGGLDSSIIVALMQQHAGREVKTFSIGFPVPEYDESAYARAVAGHLGTDHCEFRVEPSALEVLPKLVWHFDEPMADSSAVPTYYLAKVTRQHVTVALSGDGGDELFAGYPRYRAVRLGELFDALPGPVRELLAARAWQWLPASPRQKSWRRRFKKLTAALGQSPRRRYLQWIAIFDEARRATLYTDDFLARLPDDDPFESLQRAYARSGERDMVSASSFADLETYLPDDLMTKVDIASMANSLECRQPFLDYRVVELAVGMPIDLKLRFLQGKRILRRAFGHLLPARARRRRKMGFGVPLDHWFRRELRDYARQVLLDPHTLGRGYFRAEAVEQLLEEHQNGRFDHAYRLWALLFFELWQQRWLDG